MTAERNDLARSLSVWLENEAAPRAPSELRMRVADATRSRRPRPAWFATLRGDGLADRRITWNRPALGLGAALVLLAIALVAALVAGTAEPIPTPIPQVPEAVDALIDIPEDLTPRLEVLDVERAVLNEMRVESVGLVQLPIQIRTVTLLPANTTYRWGNPELHASITFEEQTWIVEVDGMYAKCSSFCDAGTSHWFNLGDTSPGPFHPTGEHTGRGAFYWVPALTFRQNLADHGLAYVPAEIPSSGSGFVDAQTVLEHGFTTANHVQGPAFGLITVVDPGLAGKGSPMPASPSGATTRAIWWAQLMEPPVTWVVIDAVTGDVLDTGSSMVVGD